ncbi:helix-turn-helix domain-containing protein [Maribacter sp. MAR_2009_72]|uniref:helix-turn-helix domain-containing protein n=1 Tax=Maribacter sp. MAR_2009_72 TaxID=1250050 RepID=UPI00119C52E1|nr:helix-turn-helix domain-containing protein [Maribacter sp. MAR_2009_72]TVZ13964.1 helix-turn-helix protein [Maribacter sp. MAR_2009_72]
MNYVKNHIAKDFTQIPNELIRHQKLKTFAKFIYIFLASMSDNWEFKTPDLCKRLNMHSDTFVKHRDSLIEKGWLYVEEQKNINGNFQPKVYHILGKQDKHFAKKITANENISNGNFPIETPTDTVDSRPGKNHSHNNKKVEEEKEVKKDKEINKNSSLKIETKENFNGINPNPRQ